MLRDLSDYPFLVDIESFLEREGFPASLEDLLTSRYAEAGFKRILDDIEEMLEEPGSDYVEKILGFYAALLLVSMTGDRRIFRKFSEAEALRVYRRLLGSPPDHVISIISALGYRVERAGEDELCVATGFDRVSYELKLRCYSYKIPLPDYLRIVVATGIEGPEYMLENRPVSRGYVYIESKEMLATICSHLSRLRIEEKLRPRPVHEAAKAYVEEILRRARERLGVKEAPEPSEGGKPSADRYSWIEAVISRGLPDGRKRFILYVLTPYLATVLKLDEEEALKVVREFLENSCRNYGGCGKVYDSWVKSCFRGAKQKGIKPARLDRLGEDLRKIVESVLSREP